MQRDRSNNLFSRQTDRSTVGGSGAKNGNFKVLWTLSCKFFVSFGPPIFLFLAYFGSHNTVGHDRDQCGFCFIQNQKNGLLYSLTRDLVGQVEDRTKKEERTKLPLRKRRLWNF